MLFIRSLPSSHTSSHQIPRKWRLILVNISLDDLLNNKERIISLLHPAHTVMDFNIGSILWFGANAKGMRVSECVCRVGKSE